MTTFLISWFSHFQAVSHCFDSFLIHLGSLNQSLVVPFSWGVHFGLLICTTITFMLLFLIAIFLILNLQWLQFWFSFLQKIQKHRKLDIKYLSPDLTDSIIKSYIQNLNLGVLAAIFVLLNQGSIIGAQNIYDNFIFGIFLYIIVYIILSSNFVFEFVKIVMIFPHILAKEFSIDLQSTNEDSTPAMDKTAGGSSLNVNKFEESQPGLGANTAPVQEEINNSLDTNPGHLQNSAGQVLNLRVSDNKLSSTTLVALNAFLKHNYPPITLCFILFIFNIKSLPYEPYADLVYASSFYISSENLPVTSALNHKIDTRLFDFEIKPNMTPSQKSRTRKKLREFQLQRTEVTAIAVWGSNMELGIDSPRVLKTYLYQLYSLPRVQFSVVMGCMLSDGWASKPDSRSINYRFGFKQSIEKFESFWRAYQIMGPYCGSLPTLVKAKKMGKSFMVYKCKLDRSPVLQK